MHVPQTLFQYSLSEPDMCAVKQKLLKETFLFVFKCKLCSLGLN